MKKLAIFLSLGLLVGVSAYAADAAAPQAPVEVKAEAAAPAAPAAPVAAEAVVPVVAEAVAPVVAEAVAPAAAEAAAPAAPAANTDNLEFVSGEISGTDEAAKSITIKLYGETENAAKDKTLAVTVDSATDITDGEKDRDFKSLTAGTEVDVEYDPATKKATYIFVY